MVCKLNLYRKGFSETPTGKNEWIEFRMKWNEVQCDMVARQQHIMHDDAYRDVYCLLCTHTTDGVSINLLLMPVHHFRH